MGLTTKEIGSSSFNDMISSVDRRSEYVENRANANVTLNNFLTPYTLDNKSCILNAPCGYSNGAYASLRPEYKLLPNEIIDEDSLTLSGWSRNGNVYSAVNASSNVVLNYLNGNPGFNYSIGDLVQVSFTISDYVQGGVKIQFSNGGSASYTPLVSANGTYTYTLKLVGNNTDGAILSDGTSPTLKVSNVSFRKVQEADFDFSRGSSATRVNDKGLIEDVQILSGNLVQNGDFEEIGSELVTNGNFDTDSDWQKANAVIEDGVAKFQESVGTFSRVRQDTGYTGQAKVTYTISFNNTSATTMQLRSYGGGMINSAIPATVGTHTLYVNFTSNGISFQSGNFASGEEIHLDNVSVKEVGQNWTFGAGTTISGGAANFVNATEVSLYQNIGTQTGIVKVEFTVTNYTSGTLNVYSGGNQSVGVINVSANALGTYTTNVIRTGGNNNIIFGSSDASNFTGSIDNVSVIEITDDTDIPRIDYTSGQGALLLEPQSTNKVTQSETFSTWGTTNASLTSANLAAPDGSTSVVKMSSSIVGGGEHKVKFNVGTNPATSSIFAKMGEVRYIMNRRQTPATSWQSVVFDLQEGVIAANNYSSNAYPKITHYGNGWYRCEVYYPSVNNNETGWGLSNGTDQNYSATNTTDGLYIWGAQQEDLSYATSYIPTEGSTVTRNAELADNSGNADLINSTEGVLYAEILKKQDNNDNFILISLNNDASNTDHNSVTLGFDAHIDFYFRVKSNNTVVLLSDTITANKNQFYKVALKYKSGDCAVWIDGVKQATSTTAFTFAQTLDNLSFDYKGNGQLPFYGNVKSVAVFKEALTDEELAQITSATQQEVFYEMRDRMNIKNYDYYEFGDYTTRLKKLF